MSELQRDAPLFDKILPMRLQSGLQEARQVPLTVRIIPGIRPTNISGQNEKLIHLEVTDENDPYFLYVLDVGEQDFHHLKRDQSLLVEFPVFPSKLIELLELCLKCSNSGSHGNGVTALASSSGEQFISNSSEFNSSTFTANLEISSGMLAIVESNKFKQLTHISLQLRPGNDSAVKAYLSSRLTFITTVANKKNHDLHSALNELTTARQHNHQMSSELSELKALRDTDVQIVRSRHMEEVTRIRMEQLNALENERAKSDVQVSDLQTAVEVIQNDFQKSKESNEQQISELTLERNQLDFKVRELTIQFDAVHADRSRLKEETATLVVTKRNVEEEKGLLEKTLARLEARFEASIQQLKDREETMAHSVALLKAGDEARRALEEKLAVYVENLEYLQEKLESGGTQINRGNALMERLQSDGKQLKEKIKLKSEIIRKQESVVTDLRAQSIELGHEISRGKESLRAVQLHSEMLQRQVQEAHERLDESSKVIVSNQEVISYLNEEINKWQIGLSGTSGAQGDYGKYDSKYGNKYESKYENKYDAYESYTDNDSTQESKNVLRASRNHSLDHSATALRKVPVNVISFSPENLAIPQSLKSQNGSSRNNFENTGETVDNLLFCKLKNSENGYEYGKDRGKGQELEKESGRDIYLRGMQNLGLGESFGTLEGLGLDLSVGAIRDNSFDINNNNNNNNSYTRSNRRGGDYSGNSANTKYNDSTNFLSGAGRVGTGSASGSKRGGGSGIDLESLEYYNTGPSSRSKVQAHFQ